MCRNILAFCALLCVALGLGQTHAAELGKKAFGLEDLQTALEQENPLLKSRRAEVLVARERAAQAGAGSDPMLATGLLFFGYVMPHFGTTARAVSAQVYHSPPQGEKSAKRTKNRNVRRCADSKLRPAVGFRSRRNRHNRRRHQAISGHRRSQSATGVQT